MRTYFDLLYAGEQVLDLYLPEEEDFDLFIYFHGGGLEKGDKKDASKFANDLTSLGIGVVSVNYRMYPNAQYPEFIEDAASAVAWVKENIGNYGVCKRTFLGGSSAGGYLSMMLCFDDRYLGRYGIDPASFAGYIHDAGQPTAHFKVLKESGVDSRRVIVDERAPIFFVGLQERYAPMLFVVSDQDMKCRYEQTMLMIETLRHFDHGEQISLRVMSGRHCAYLRQTDENGKNLFGSIVSSYILNEKGKSL